MGWVGGLFLVKSSCYRGGNKTLNPRGVEELGRLQVQANALKTSEKTERWIIQQQLKSELCQREYNKNYTKSIQPLKNTFLLSKTMSISPFRFYCSLFLCLYVWFIEFSGLLDCYSDVGVFYIWWVFVHCFFCLISENLVKNKSVGYWTPFGF